MRPRARPEIPPKATPRGPSERGHPGVPRGSPHSLAGRILAPGAVKERKSGTKAKNEPGTGRSVRTKNGAGPTLGVVRRKETCCETPGGEAPGASRCRDWAAAQSPELRAAAAASGRHPPSPWCQQRPQLGEQAPPRDDCAGRPRAPPRPARSPCVPRAGGLARPARAASALLGAHRRSPRAARGTSSAPPSPRGEGAQRSRTFPRNPPGAGDVCRPLRWARRGRARRFWVWV